MPTRRTRVASAAVDGELTTALAELRTDLPTEFPAEVLAEAESATASEPDKDLREVPFVTLDPAGARDLDQALQLERAARGSGWRVRYAIADVPGFVAPGGAIDAEARRRGQTMYLPDGTIPLHPRVLSEDRVSLLPGVDRSAYVWSFDLDETGAVTSVRLERAMIRSRAQLDYATVQAGFDNGMPPESVALLAEVGRARVEQERLRGGASLNLPDEQIVPDASGAFRIERRAALEVEDWNGQLSLMTGMAAATIMLGAGVGILRTMPAPDQDASAQFRARTAALGVPWGESETYGKYLRGLDRNSPVTQAIVQAATSLFRGAGYAAFDGDTPADDTQAAIGAPYAHVTAPLRRLVDRWGLVVCEAQMSGRAVPEWARDSLGELPGVMQQSGSRASRLSAQALDVVEAALLNGREGEQFSAIVLETGERSARIQLTDPPVTARCDLASATHAGDVIQVELVRADIPRGAVTFRARSTLDPSS